MKSRFGLLLAVSVVALFVAAGPQPLQAKSDAEQICVSVGRLLEEGHYTRQPLNDQMSQKFLRRLISSCSISVTFFSPRKMSML